MLKKFKNVFMRLRVQNVNQTNGVGMKVVMTVVIKICAFGKYVFHTHHGVALLA